MSRKSHHADGWAWDQKRPNLAEKLVLLCLAKHAGFQAECWPNMETLAELTGVSRRQVIRAIQALEADGLITRQRRRRQNGSQTSSMYLLHIDQQSDTMSPRQSDTSDAQGDTTSPLNETKLEAKNIRISGRKGPDARSSPMSEIPQDDARVRELRRAGVKMIPTTRFTFIVPTAAL